MTHRVAIAGSDIAFGCSDSESVLEAARRAGIELPYSCRKGVCGNCAGRIVAGEVAGLGGAPMRNESCLTDQVLFCTCAPRTDLMIAPVSWHRIDPAARKHFKVKVFRNQLAAPDVSVLELRLPIGRRAKFRAGQYLQVDAGNGTTRCYSMANAPHESDTLTLHIRHVPGGVFSSRVQALRPGDGLDIELPFGAVALDSASARRVVFVVGGTGFAPVQSLLDDMAKRRIVRPITLIWGARRADGIYQRSAVERWRAQWADFHFVEALSDEARQERRAFAGRVDDALIANFDRLTDCEVYCCGSPAMVAAVRLAAVQRLGLAVENFFSDVFVEGPA